jgi:hypothetical protein
MHRLRHAIRAVLAAAPLFTAGCLVTGGSKVEESGMRVTASTLDQVETGVTTDAWLRAALGEPTSRETISPEGATPVVELWRYRYTRTETERGTVFLIFSGRSHEQSSTTTWFELTDGVVTRFWTEA